eukprot:TRINITY_DN2571_c0_g1_i1.p1 TRINITY_DN2571_c0_g1~~TRINITY_DN2571_c0_g1_i1.p1  ORF type:complete len:268 (+),score=43.19 TRINITY_DN2571_c0_g1_i1:54-857(+)
MKVVFVLLIIVSVVFCHNHKVQKKVHNEVRIAVNGNLDTEGWLLDCRSELEDSPPGCSMSEVRASNDSTAKQICARKCALCSSTLKQLQTPTIEFEVYDSTTKKNQQPVTCPLTWASNQFLVGYDLDVHYTWIEHPSEPFIKVTSCVATPIASKQAPAAGDQFIATRTLVLDRTIDVVAVVVVAVLMMLALGACCCAGACCFTCLCLKAMKPKKRRRTRRTATPQQELTYQMPQAQSNMPYFVVSPYSPSAQPIQMVPVSLSKKESA